MRVYDYSAQELLVYDDTNYPVYDGHPRMQNLVYVDRHVQVAPAALSAFVSCLLLSVACMRVVRAVCVVVRFNVFAAEQGHLHERHSAKSSRLY